MRLPHYIVLWECHRIHLFSRMATLPITEMSITEGRGGRGEVQTPTILIGSRHITGITRGRSTLDPPHTERPICIV